jgi:hypothetical protein
VAGSLTFFLGMFYRAYPPLMGLLPAGNIWLGFIAIMFAAMLVKLPADLLLPRQQVPLTAALAVLSLAAGGYSLFNVSGPVRVREFSIVSDKLPVPSFRIVHVSDLHLSRVTDVKWLEAVVAAVNAQKADAVAITGDVIDDGWDGVAKFAGPLKRMNAAQGVFAVPGNHDHYAGLGNMQALMRAAGIRLLQNDAAPAGAVKMIGIDDEDENVMAVFGPTVRTLAGGGTLPVVLLKHRPVGFETAAGAGVFLQLSGHTHAGQIPPLDLIVRLVFTHPYGLYALGGSYIYTTCGTGTWGPPMRLFSSSEIAVITLKQPSASGT